MKQSIKIYVSVFIILFTVIFSANNSYANSNNEIEEHLYESVDNTDNNRNVSYASGVTEEMTSSSYWADKLGDDADKILLTSEEIETVNEEIIIGSGTGVINITGIVEGKTQEERKQVLADAIESDFNYMVRNYPARDRQLYVNGELIDNIPYIENMKEAVLNTGFEDNSAKVQLYAVGVKRTEIRMYPTSGVWGYDNANDPDDEAVNSALDVNEPFVIRAKCTINDETFYWGFSYNCSGWVEAEDVAIFETKDEWIESWKVEVGGNDFIVVTQDGITLEPSQSNASISNVELRLGTVLKLVPSDEIPETVNNRGTWNNYVVYLPTRDENGKYVKSYALIAEHHNVSIGYLPLTQRNLLNIAFSCLGNRYGWGGMLGAMDCTLYTRTVYKCFGLDIPRNTTSQQNVPNRVFNIADLDDEQKENVIEGLPVGTIMFFPGHAVIYVGNENGTSYVISDTGSLSDSEGEVSVRSMYSVIVNPLTVRRRNGSTWLTNLNAYLTFISGNSNADESDVYVTTGDENENKGNITYSEGITESISNSDYWKDLLEDKDNVLISKDEIDELNKKNNINSEFDINGKNFIVVTQDRIILEPSISQPEISKVELPMGTVLELVPEEEIPTNIAERGPWNNYVVYLPVTMEDGTVERKYALIPEHYCVNVGYLDLTPENIIDVAFRCLGDSYELMDNEEFINSLYKCFGIEFLNNTEVIKNKIQDVSKMSKTEKIEYLKNIPVGSVLVMPDKKVIYLGCKDNKIYTIGSIETANNKTINSIILGNMELKNSDETTWLDSLTSVIDFSKQEEIKQEYIVITGDNQTLNPSDNSVLTVKFNIDFSKFEETGKVYVDNKEVPSSFYKANKGSTIITISNDYLKTLSNGEHELKVAVADGEAVSTFKIDNKETKSNDDTNQNVNKTTNTIKTDNLNTDKDEPEYNKEETKKQNSNTSKSVNPKTGDNIETVGFIIIVSLMVICAIHFKRK